MPLQRNIDVRQAFDNDTVETKRLSEILKRTHACFRPYKATYRQLGKVVSGISQPRLLTSYE